MPEASGVNNATIRGDGKIVHLYIRLSSRLELYLFTVSVEVRR